MNPNMGPNMYPNQYMGPNMQMDPTAQMAEEIYAEEQRLETAYKDTYEQRKLEGRPYHTMLSYALVGLGLVSFLLQCCAVCMTSWRGNWIGVLGYPMSRQWGLWAVKGSKGTVLYTDQSKVACELFGQMHVGGFCISPLCLWYKVKCTVYLDMWVFTMAIGIAFCIVLLVHAACVAWTAMLTPQSIQYASIGWAFVVFAHISLLVGYFFFTEDQYDALNIYSYYPTPYLDFGFFFSSLAALVLCALAVLGCNLSSVWPVPDVDTDTEDEYDLDDDESG